MLTLAPLSIRQTITQTHIAGAVLTLAPWGGSILYEGQLTTVPVLARFSLSLSLFLSLSLPLSLSLTDGGAHAPSSGLWNKPLQSKQGWSGWPNIVEGTLGGILYKINNELVFV